MAEISFSFTELFQKAFGYKTQAFDPKMKLIEGNGGVDNLQRTEFGAYGSEYYAEDALGREYFMPVKVTYVEDREQGGDTVIADQRGTVRGGNVSIKKDWYLPYPVISISSKKTIIETPLTERTGTVKEFINIQDYEIVIKGLIISASNEFPEQDVATMRTMYEQNTPISIKCPLTDIFLLRSKRNGSDQAVITSLSFPNSGGVKHVCPYELRMVSDAPFSLISITS